MGSDAIILDTRKYKKGGFLGFFKSQQVEVIAALEDEKKDLNSKETLKQINNLKKMIADLKQDNKQNYFQNISQDFLPVFKYLLKQGVNKKNCKKIIKEIKSDKNYLK